MAFEDTTRIGVPANPLLIVDKPDLFKVMANTRLALVAALICVLLVVLARRRRRGSAPVYLSGGLVLPSVIIVPAALDFNAARTPSGR